MYADEVKKTYTILLSTLSVALLVAILFTIMSSQVVTYNVFGDALITAAQKKIDYNTVSSIASVVVAVSAAILALLVFGQRIAGWGWLKKLP